MRHLRQKLGKGVALPSHLLPRDLMQPLREEADDYDHVDTLPVGSPCSPDAINKRKCRAAGP